MNNSGFFQISADFHLAVKPDWLDSFRIKYDLPYDFHITLKTTTTFQTQDLENLKGEIKRIVGDHRSISVVFNELYIAPAPSGFCIMIKAERNEELLVLQKEVVLNFLKYGNHVSNKKESYEKNFDPHITIGRHLTAEQLESAKSELKEDLRCEALLETLTLTIVPEDSFAEWSKLENRLFYRFN